MAPSLLFVKQTYRRILNLRAGIKGLVFLPLTVTSLVIFVFFILGFLAQFPLFNLSWLGYNIAVGPYVDQGFSGILPFVPFLIYTFIHVNYFESELHDKCGVDYAYALHFSTNMTILSISIISFIVMSYT